MEGFKSDERSRAEDILLGALGYGEDAQIDLLEPTKTGFKGQGHFTDGESFSFENDGELSDLEQWALGILLRAIS